MKIYTIATSCSDNDSIRISHFKTDDVAKDKVVNFFKKVMLQTACKVGTAPEFISCIPVKDDFVEIYHGMIQLPDSHIEFSLCEYTEEQCIERLSADENFLIGDEISFDATDDHSVDIYLSKVLKPTKQRISL